MSPARPPTADRLPSPGLGTTDDDQRRAGDLRRMKALATGLLLAAVALFAVTRSLEGSHPWVGYVRAFAEASMVGALADWFAVTALFRRPLRLPIPHTAIIPTRKDDIGRGLGAFVQTHFLTPAVVEERLRSTPIAARLGGWLAVPEQAARVGDQVGTVGRVLLDAVQDADVQEALERAVSTRVRSTPAGPAMGRVLDLAVAEDRHQQLLSAVLARAADVLDENRDVLRRRLDRESPWWVPAPIDDRVFAKLFSTTQRLLAEVAADTDHELRAAFDERVRRLATELSDSEEMQVRADALKEDVLAHPALRSWSASVWADVKAGLLRRSADPDSELRRRVQSALVDLGRRLQSDEALQARVDSWLVSATVAVVEQSKGEVGDLIAATVQRWDPEESSRRIELAVGRDLQFIRINGTVVGGLAGLVIYAVGQFVAH